MTYRSTKHDSGYKKDVTSSAYSTSDTISTLVRKGKITPLLRSSGNTFAHLGKSEEIPDIVFAELEHSTCILYEGLPKN